MRVAFFEDRIAAEDFSPIALMRPVFELVCGHYSMRERVVRALTVTSWGVLIRDYLADLYREQHAEAAVNDAVWLSQGSTLLLNGRWLPDLDALHEIREGDVGIVDGTIAYLTLDPAEAILISGGTWDDALYQIARTRNRVEAGGRLVARPWHLIEHNAAQISTDFQARRYRPAPRDYGPQVALLGPFEAIHIDPAAQIDPFVVIDARQGPVSIEAGCVVEAFTRIQGPCHIGQKTHLNRANIASGTTIGPVCRVGGELQASILHGYINKAHDGFLGHSYVCPWVNLGAMTTNSNLKNDYSSVRFPTADAGIDSGLVKLGCFIGDHTKTGLGSLFNTGTYVGVMCMVLPSGELLPKYIPSFASVWHGKLAAGLTLERSTKASSIAMLRRNCELSIAEQRVLEYLYRFSKSERDALISRTRREFEPAPLPGSLCPPNPPIHK